MQSRVPHGRLCLRTRNLEVARSIAQCTFIRSAFTMQTRLLVFFVSIVCACCIASKSVSRISRCKRYSSLLIKRFLGFCFHNLATIVIAILWINDTMLENDACGSIHKNRICSILTLSHGVTSLHQRLQRSIAAQAVECPNLREES
jgi:hypothetical protein